LAVARTSACSTFGTIAFTRSVIAAGGGAIAFVISAQPLTSGNERAARTASGSASLGTLLRISPTAASWKRVRARQSRRVVYSAGDSSLRSFARHVRSCVAIQSRP
jgi:hypothetical protein